MLFISVRQIDPFLTSISSDVSSSEVVADRRWSTHLISGQSAVEDTTVLLFQLCFHTFRKETCGGMKESFVLEGAGAEQVPLTAAFRDGRLCLD